MSGARSRRLGERGQAVSRADPEPGDCINSSRIAMQGKVETGVFAEAHCAMVHRPAKSEQVIESLVSSGQGLPIP